MKYLLPLLLTPTAALAHPGDHSGFSVQGVLAHFASAPDHVAMIVVGLAVVGLMIYRRGARK